jgi:Na+/H+ antiporter NhaD/arsenite permease-like protein
MLRLCEVMELEPIPVLLLMIIYSNIGGTATAIGDPPNVLIVSDENIKEAVSFIETFCPPKQPMQSLNSQF